MTEPEMTDEAFLEAAIDRLPDEVCQAAAACAAAQYARPLTPGEVIAIADIFKAPRGPVLALMGWVHSEKSRSNRFVFLDVFKQRVRREDMKGAADRDTVLGLAVCRTLMNQT